MTNKEAINYLIPPKATSTEPSAEYQKQREAYEIAVDALRKTQWIPFKSRPLTEEEKADYPDWEYILDGRLPEDGQRILVSIKYKGHEAVQMDEYVDDGGISYLDSGYDLVTEATAWMPLPEAYKGGEENGN